jgi:hypothetical protein
LAAELFSPSRLILGFKDGCSDIHPGSYRVWRGGDDRINNGNVGLDLFRALCSGPAQLYRQLEATIPPPQISGIELILHDNNMWLEGGLKDAEGHDLPDAMIFRVRSTNVGNKFLQQCQVTFGQKDRYSYPVSGHFDLRRGEYKDIPFLRINHLSDNPHPFIYFLNSDWQIDTGGPRWLVPPSIYEIRVLSADTHPASLNVELSVNQLPLHPPEWKLAVC